MQTRDKARGGALPRLLAAGLIALVLLSLFALVYNQSGVKQTNPTGATATCWKGRQYYANMTEGFSWFLTDENGYNNASIPDVIDVLITGDSHMEGAQLPHRDNIAAVLERLLDEQTVYNIGIKGNFLNFGIQNAENALRTYRPRRALVLDVSDRTLFQDLDDMKLIIAGEKERVPANFESGPMYWLKQIPCVKPLLYGLKDWIITPRAQSYPPPELVDAEYIETLEAFLAVYKRAADEAGVKAIIMYLPWERIHADGSFSYDGDPEYLALFADACEKNGIVFLDLTEDFRAATAREHTLMHGFANTTPGEGHLNRTGHRVAAEALARVLTEAEARP